MFFTVNSTCKGAIVFKDYGLTILYSEKGEKALKAFD